MTAAQPPELLAPDPTAQTEPLTTGQLIVSRYERDMIAEPCELAAAIDKAIADARPAPTPEAPVDEEKEKWIALRAWAECGRAVGPGESFMAGWLARSRLSAGALAVEREKVAALSDMLLRAAAGLESRSLDSRKGETFLHCNICGTPADDEDGPQHTPGCFISECRALSTPADGEAR